MANKKINEIENHKHERIKHQKIFGKHSNWDVFTHNLFKLVCVDMLSRSFLVVVGSLLFTGWFLNDQLEDTKEGIGYLELLVAIVPPSFFAFYWIERNKATEMAKDFMEAIKYYFQGKK